MARPKKTEGQYLSEYAGVILEIGYGTPYRTIAKEYGVGVCTVQRLAKMGLHLYLIREIH